MTAPSARSSYASMVSLIEVPILNEKYWSKVPGLDADGIMLDLEDSAPPAQKSAVRAAVVDALRNPGYFGGRRVVVRCNNLDSPWGREDLEALAGAATEFVVSYPKIEHVGELDALAGILGECARVHVMIETPAALIHVDEIAAHRSVVGLHYGYVDFAAESGSRPFDAEGELSELTTGYARSRIAIAAAAHGLFSTGGTLIPDYKDEEKVTRLVRSWADLGYTACIAVTPAHLPIINRVMRPSQQECDRARTVVNAYDAALAEGNPAAVLNGRVITMPDYRVAQLVLERAGATAVDGTAP